MLRREKKRKSRGWVPFGYRYLGPGNDLNRGKPLTEGDAVAQKHDWQYYQLEKDGVNPYYSYVEEDDEFLRNLHPKYASEWIAQNIFRAKKRLAEKGWIIDLRASQRAKRDTTPNDYKQFITPTKKIGKDVGFTPPKMRRIVMSKFASLPNLQEERTMASNSNPNKGSGHEGGLQETKVDPVPREVFRGPPDQMFASLPFYNERTFNLNFNTYDYVVRPTSPYDCYVENINATGTDINIGSGSTIHVQALAANTTDATIYKARWFDYYASMYKYYHVIACKYEIYVENQCNDDMWVHLMPCNDVYPPVHATNVDMLQWNDCESQCLSGRAIPITDSGQVETQEINTNVDMDEGNDTAGAIVNFEANNHLLNQLGKKAHVFNGVYRTGDYDRQIRLDANVENWTETNTNPKLVERLLLRIKTHWDSWGPNVIPNDAINRNRLLKALIRVKMEYLVEFKELKDGLKYPTSDQPYVAQINTGI